MDNFVTMVVVFALGVLVVGRIASSDMWMRWRYSLFFRQGVVVNMPVTGLVNSHFPSTANLCIAERTFPFRVRADLQRAIETVFSQDVKIAHFCGIAREYGELRIADCLSTSNTDPVRVAPPEYEELDIGDAKPLRCLKNGLWLLEKQNIKYMVVLIPALRYGETTGIQFQIATPNNPEGTQIAQDFFRQLEEAVFAARSYRGKILSLEKADESYTGEASGIKVHKLRTVEKDQVILPKRTVELLDRNVIHLFVSGNNLQNSARPRKKNVLRPTRHG